MGRVGLLARRDTNGRHARRALAAVGLVLAAAIAVLAYQPVGSPWWINADADASYTASGIELADGEDSVYLDHPGMPLQDLMAITVGARYAVHRLTGATTSRHAYAAERLLNLADSRPYFRGWAIIFFLSGAVVTLLALWRLLGGPWWGVAGALLWLGAPALADMSIQFRPDGLLAGLVVACGYLIARAAQRRDAWTYILAAFLLGITITVKLHAAGLAVPFAIALLWRPPSAEWRTELSTAARGAWHRFRSPLLVFAAVWIVLCIIFNWGRSPITLTHEQRTTVIELVAVFGDYLLAVLLLSKLKWRRGPFSPFGAILLSSFALGILLPGTLFLNDLPEMLFKIVGGLTGGGVNQGIKPFTTPLSTLFTWPLDYTLILVCLAGVAAIVGVVRRDPFPLLWFSGAVTTGLMALARLGTIHYFEPAYVLSIPAVLWLLRAFPRPARLPVVATLLAVMLVPVVHHLPDAAASATSEEQHSQAFEALAGQLLKPGDLALTDSYAAPTPDTRWFGLVHQYVSWSPPYPYRFLPADAGPATAIDEGLRPTYYIGALPLQLTGNQQEVFGFGTYELQPLPSTFDPNEAVGAARLVHGPGVDEPLVSP